MSRIAIGTAQFGLAYGIANAAGRIPDDEAREILASARRAGVDTLDTAVAYGDSEARLGSLGAADWNVVSKLPPCPDPLSNPAGWVTSQVAASLTRLRSTRLAALLLHRPQQLLEPGGDGIYQGLERAQRDGLVGKIGVSIYVPEELEAICARYRFDVVQAPFSVIDRRLITSGWMERLSIAGTELHVRSVFLQGLLLMSSSARPRRFDRWSTLWARWEHWLGVSGLTAVQACLRDALSFPAISRVVVGVDSPRQLGEILAASEGAAPAVPAEFAVADVKLLNPSNWESL